MKTAILILAIYLMGAVTSYVLGKKYSKKVDNKYTISDRAANVWISMFSWFGVLAFIIILFGDWYEKNKNNPAKW